MSTSNFTLRDIPDEVMVLLRKEAKRLRISVNDVILKLIKQELVSTNKRHIHHDLDHLAGTWSKEEAKAFLQATHFFGTLQ